MIAAPEQHLEIRFGFARVSVILGGWGAEGAIHRANCAEADAGGPRACKGGALAFPGGLQPKKTPL